MQGDLAEMRRLEKSQRQLNVILRIQCCALRPMLAPGLISIIMSICVTRMDIAAAERNVTALQPKRIFKDSGVSKDS